MARSLFFQGAIAYSISTRKITLSVVSYGCIYAYVATGSYLLWAYLSGKCLELMPMSQLLHNRDLTLLMTCICLIAINTQLARNYEPHVMVFLELSVKLDS